jgi:ABC-type branched-subunit amino acid transport system ATPase component
MSDKVYLLGKGHICWTGSNTALQSQPDVIKQYLVV